MEKAPYKTQTCGSPNAAFHYLGSTNKEHKKSRGLDKTEREPDEEGATEMKRLEGNSIFDYIK